MNKGSVYYRKSDDQHCTIKGFFFLHRDDSRSFIYENLKDIYQVIFQENYKGRTYVLFTDDTFDLKDNLFTNLYITESEYYKTQEYVQKVENTKGLSSAFQVALDFTPIPFDTRGYKLKPLEEVLLWLDSDLVPNPR